MTAGLPLLIVAVRARIRTSLQGGAGQDDHIFIL